VVGIRGGRQLVPSRERLEALRVEAMTRAAEGGRRQLGTGERSSHAVWECRYHVVWATKRRKRALKEDHEREYCARLFGGRRK